MRWCGSKPIRAFAVKQIARMVRQYDKLFIRLAGISDFGLSDFFRLTEIAVGTATTIARDFGMRATLLGVG